MEVDIHSRIKETLVVIFNFDPPLKEDNARFTSEPFEIFIYINYAENIVVYFSQLFFYCFRRKIFASHFYTKTAIEKINL